MIAVILNLFYLSGKKKKKSSVQIVETSTAMNDFYSVVTDSPTEMLEGKLYLFSCAHIKIQVRYYCVWEWRWRERKQKCQWRDKVENPRWEACHDKQMEADCEKKKVTEKHTPCIVWWNCISKSHEAITAFSPNKSYFWKTKWLIFSDLSSLCKKLP